MNLEGVKVKLPSQKIIKVNQKLQATNTKIYAYSSAIGSYNLFKIIKNKASIAIKIHNSFYWEVKYNHLSYVIITDFPVSAVGLTETEAVQLHKTNIIVVE
ncbi:MAG: hypothetical protein ACQJCO_06660 [cyanobacterium endosymbiont of Rhopalodia sterrenbergii]